jgi:hypothetical protein
VVVGYTGAIARSQDGFLWSTMSQLWAYDIWDIEYGNGRFIALAGSAQGGSNVWYHLTAAIGAPMPRIQLQSPSPLAIMSLSASHRTGRFSQRRTGFDWVAYQTESTSLSSVDFCEGRFIVAFRSDHEYTSSDGINWNLEPSQDHSCGLRVPTIIIPSPTERESTSALPGTGKIWSSIDGQDWVLRQQAPPIITNEFSVTFSALRHVAFGGGMFVAVGRRG